MKLLVNGFEPVFINVGVDLSSGYIGMAKHKLYGA